MENHFLFVKNALSRYILHSLFILILTQVSLSQTISIKQPCYVVNNIIPGQTYDYVFASLGISNIKPTKTSELFFINDKIIYVYREVVWRIEYKNIKLNCNYDFDNKFNVNNIRVAYTEDEGTSVTDMGIYFRLLVDNITYHKSTKSKRKSKKRTHK